MCGRGQFSRQASRTPERRRLLVALVGVFHQLDPDRRGCGDRFQDDFQRGAAIDRQANNEIERRQSCGVAGVDARLPGAKDLAWTNSEASSEAVMAPSSRLDMGVGSRRQGRDPFSRRHARSRLFD